MSERNSTPDRPERDRSEPGRPEHGRPGREDAGTRIDDPVVSQRESADVAGVAEQEQVPGRAGDAAGGAMPRPRAEAARAAADEVGPGEITESKRDIAPGGTIETALTPSGTESMVASQLLWDGSSATSRIDRSIAEAVADSDVDPATDPDESTGGGTGGGTASDAGSGSG
ncbi:hypothetical protein ACQP1K_03290 [Sphaerimonospora sp. CA-214678]|uniref:hypothetical protein n=1 Tax=Sphaerimonospora sp. CA-214678 TaxID=3240029 RepID=UPI003D920387